jgi:hypothetical protein
MVSDPMDC